MNNSESKSSAINEEKDINFVDEFPGDWVMGSLDDEGIEDADLNDIFGENASFEGFESTDVFEDGDLELGSIDELSEEIDFGSFAIEGEDIEIEGEDIDFGSLFDEEL